MQRVRFLAHLGVAAVALLLAIAAWQPRAGSGGTTTARVAGARPSAGTARPPARRARAEHPARTRRAAISAPRRPVSILVIGDSTAKSVGHGLSQWSQHNPTAASVTIDGAPGCGLVPGGTRVFVEGEQPVPDGCRRYLEEEVPAMARRLHPDLVLVMSSWEVFDRRWHGGPVLGPADRDYRLRMFRAVTDLVASLRAAGVPRISLVLEPVTDPYWRLRYSVQEDPRRHLPLHGVMAEVARRDPEHVRLADVDHWLTAIGRLEDRSLRPDGVHWSWNGSQLLAGAFLGPLLVHQATS